MNLVADADPEGKGAQPASESPFLSVFLMRRQHEILSLLVLKALCPCLLGFWVFWLGKNVAVFVLLPGASHKPKDVTQGQC